MTRYFPVARPTGMLRMSRFVPDKTVESSHPDQIDKIKKAGLSLHMKTGFFITFISLLIIQTVTSCNCSFTQFGVTSTKQLR